LQGFVSDVGTRTLLAAVLGNQIENPQVGRNLDPARQRLQTSSALRELELNLNDYAT
jgi:hypothetical protein